MYVQLTMAERLKDLRVINKKLTLEQLAEQPAYRSLHLANMRTRIAATSITTPFRSWQSSMAYPPIISWA